jgi:hypothetical protein
MQPGSNSFLDMARSIVADGKIETADAKLRFEITEGAKLRAKRRCSRLYFQLTPDSKPTSHLLKTQEGSFHHSPSSQMICIPDIAALELMDKAYSGDDSR